MVIHVIPLLVFKIIAGVCTSFLAITFLQSSHDKIYDYKGNLAYFRSQFANSILKNSVGFLLPVLTVMEAATGLTCVAGNIARIFFHNPLIMGISLTIGSLTLLSLLLGQRLAKDYAGAASITGYFIVAMFGLIGFAGSI
jgi:hypothetical protein